MENKYLPIGTICTVKGNTKKVMITGFLKTSYNGNLKQYDYVGCVYPEGSLLNDKQIAFDHSDIEKVDFMGYQTELHNNLNSILNSNSIGSTSNDNDSKKEASSFVFDENGVVIFDNTATNNKTEIEESTSVENPFNLEYKPESNMEINSNNNSFKFDENGVVIEDNSMVDLDKKIDSIYVFDENGFVVEDRSTVTEVKEEPKTGDYSFDENGVVIADNNAQTTNDTSESASSSTYQFDENGVVIADNNTQATNDTSESASPLYQFDENGVVISDANV